MTKAPKYPYPLSLLIWAWPLETRIMIAKDVRIARTSGVRA
jgi:hypothetical protein